jgi:hypothetical protein
MTGEPKEIISGDTVAWTAEADSDYKASDGWALTYYLNGPSRLAITGVADGDNWTVTITAAESAALTVGIYELQARVSKASEAYTQSVTKLEVLANPATQVAGYEARSHNQIALDAINAAIEGRATHAEQAVTIGAKSIQYMTFEELITAKMKYERFVESDEAAERVNKGLQSGRQVGVRFNQT